MMDAAAVRAEIGSQAPRHICVVDDDDEVRALLSDYLSRHGLRVGTFPDGASLRRFIARTSVDLVILSQALHHAEDPAKAIAGAYGILKPGGSVMILDLAKHNFEKAHELYGDRWPGFAESDLHRWLEAAGFQNIEITVVAREEEPPHFETILASGKK